MDGMFPTYIWYSLDGRRFVVIGLYLPRESDEYGREWFATNYQSMTSILGRPKIYSKLEEVLQDISENISLSRALKVELRQVAVNGIQVNTLYADAALDENLALAFTEASTSLNTSLNVLDDIPF